MDCFFKVESLVDFLAFAFALNTMFSFAKIRRRLLFKLQNDIQDRLNELRPHIEDCKKEIHECIHEEESRKNLERSLKLSKIYIQAEEKKSNYHKKLQKVSKIFQFIFSTAAVFSAVILVFSGMKWLNDHYQYTLFLLVPPILFYLTYFGYWIYAKCILYKFDKDTKDFKVSLDLARNIMKEIIPKTSDGIKQDTEKTE